MSSSASVIHLSEEECLQALNLWGQCEDAREFACHVLAGVLNSVMDMQAQRLCGAQRGERTEERTNSRNGYRSRTLKTAVGTLDLEIPKLRQGSYFPDEVLFRYTRTETSLICLVEELYRQGVSTRKVEKIAKALGVESLSSSEVSRLCSHLDEEVEKFRNRDLSELACCYVWLDATYMSCREGSAYKSTGLVTAIGLGKDGRKHFLGADIVDTESEASWTGFLRDLKARGLCGVRLLISDDHAGLVAAIAHIFQGACWQRCITHLQRNLQSACAGKGEDAKKAVSELVHAATYQKDPGLAHAIWSEAAPFIGKICKSAGEIFETAETSALAFMAFPAQHWSKIRTNNVQERENREIKRRYRVVQAFPSTQSMIRLCGSVLIDAEASWANHRVFNEDSAALGFQDPKDQEPIDEGRRQALEKRAKQIVKDIVDARGLTL